MNLYQHAKSQALTLFCSRDIFHLKTLQSDWPRAFYLAHISGTRFFPSMGFVHEYSK